MSETININGVIHSRRGGREFIYIDGKQFETARAPTAEDFARGRFRVEATGFTRDAVTIFDANGAAIMVGTSSHEPVSCVRVSLVWVEIDPAVGLSRIDATFECRPALPKERATKSDLVYEFVKHASTAAKNEGDVRREIDALLAEDAERHPEHATARRLYINGMGEEPEEHPALAGLRCALAHERSVALRVGEAKVFIANRVVSINAPCWNTTSQVDGFRPKVQRGLSDVIADAQRTIDWLAPDLRQRVLAYSRIRPPTVAATEDR